MSVPLREQACEGMWRLPLSGLSSPGGACVLALDVLALRATCSWWLAQLLLGVLGTTAQTTSSSPPLLTLTMA